MTSKLVPDVDADHVTSMTTNQIVERWRAEYGLDVSETFAGSETIHLYRCSATGFEFFTPDGVAGNGSFYAQLQRIPWYYMAEKWEHDHLIRALGSRTSRILEVGCGRGDFLARLRDRGFASLLGTELNHEAAAEARGRGLAVEERPLEDILEDQEESFDCACAFQVLEHVVSPRALIDEMIRAVKPGGKIVLSVPNNKSFIRWDPKNLFNMPPHHMGRWSAPVFKSLARLLPVRLAGIHYEPLADYHVDWFTYLLARRLGMAGRGKLAELPFGALRKILHRFPGARRRIRGHSIYVVLVRE